MIRSNGLKASTLDAVVDKINAVGQLRGIGADVHATTAGYVIAVPPSAVVKPIWYGKIVTAGPNGEADFPTTCALYWVQEELLAVDSTAVQPTNSPFQFFDKPALNYDPKADPEKDPNIIADYKIFPVFNVAEHSIDVTTAVSTETHVLPAGTIVEVRAERVIYNDTTVTPPFGSTYAQFVMFASVASQTSDIGQYQYQAHVMTSDLQDGWGFIRANPLL